MERVNNGKVKASDMQMELVNEFEREFKELIKRTGVCFGSCGCCGGIGLIIPDTTDAKGFYAKGWGNELQEEDNV